jgi:hypothetical protein
VDGGRSSFRAGQTLIPSPTAFADVDNNAYTGALSVMPQFLTKVPGEYRARKARRNEPLPPGAAILCIGALSVIGWGVILILVLVLV